MSSVVTTPTDSFSELLPSCLSPPPSCLPPSFLFPPNYPITTAPDNAPFRPALALISFLLFSTQIALIIHNTVLSLNYVQTANKYTALYASTMQFDRRANRNETPPDILPLTAAARRKQTSVSGKLTKIQKTFLAKSKPQLWLDFSSILAVSKILGQRVLKGIVSLGLRSIFCWV